MSLHRWDPTCPRPEGLVWPRRIDPTGRHGPTRGQAQGKRWRRCAPGWYVPVDTDEAVVEQRILEQAARLPGTGAVSGWASLRWRGATFFDGASHGGRETLPVPLRTGVGNLRAWPGCELSHEQLPPYDRELVASLPCTTVPRATFDEMRRDGRLVTAVVAVDMAAAAGLTSVEEMAAYVATRAGWTGVPLVRKALLLASDHSRSPQETRMRLIWLIVAALPPVECNRAVFDLRGRLLGYPDLLDPVAGVVGEYDGADHRTAARHSADVSREERWRDHGLEYFTVVGPDLADPELVAGRMLRARGRAKFLSPESRAWTLTPPPRWSGPLYR